jgi:hypothetical protein
MRKLVLFVCLSGLIAPAGSDPVVHRCIGEAGEVVFSQTDCGRSRVELPLRRAQSLGDALRASERAWLAERDQRPADKVQIPRTSGTGSAANAQRQAYRCQRTRQQLDEVRAERRGGYKAGKGSKLRARQQRYETYLASFCS